MSIYLKKKSENILLIGLIFAADKFKNNKLSIALKISIVIFVLFQPKLLLLFKESIGLLTLKLAKKQTLLFGYLSFSHQMSKLYVQLEKDLNPFNILKKNNVKSFNCKTVDQWLNLFYKLL